MHQVLLRTLFLVGILLFVAGCRTPDGEQPREEATADSTQELEQLTEDLEVAYEALTAHYDTLAKTLPADTQGLYAEMQQMHRQTMGMHRQMMGTQGHRPGMMGMRMHQSPQEARLMQGTGEWHQQMAGMHQAMARLMADAGHDDLRALHGRMAQLNQRIHDVLSVEDGAAETPPDPSGEISGAVLYGQTCSGCHGANGQGMPGVFPPLAGSSWVTGVKVVPIRIVLHGLQGPVKVGGRTYDGVMPAFEARLSNREIASILSHVRSTWGNDAPVVTADEIGTVREAQGERRQPWSASALRAGVDNDE